MDDTGKNVPNRISVNGLKRRHLVDSMYTKMPDNLFVQVCLFRVTTHLRRVLCFLFAVTFFVISDGNERKTSYNIWLSLSCYSN